MPGSATDAPVHGPGSTADPVRRAMPVGTFTTPWRVVMIATWALVILAYAAVWKTSEELGIGTWWLGTRSDPSMAVLRLLPFAVAAVPAVAVAYNVARAWWASLGAGTVLLAIAIPDFSRSTGLALLELAIALAALLVTASARTGRFRAPPAAEPHATTPSVERAHAGTGTPEGGDHSEG